MSVALKAKPKRVYLVPQNIDVEFEYTDGRAELTIEKFECHQMVVFEV